MDHKNLGVTTAEDARLWQMTDLGIEDEMTDTQQNPILRQEQKGP
jgi:hypothetical protein